MFEKLLDIFASVCFCVILILRHKPAIEFLFLDENLIVELL